MVKGLFFIFYVIDFGWSQIDIDNLIGKQHFDFKRTFKRNGKLESSIIKCKIRGLRSEAFKEHLARKEAMRNDLGEDGSVSVRITECEYKITDEGLKMPFLIGAL